MNLESETQILQDKKPNKIEEKIPNNQIKLQ